MFNDLILEWQFIPQQNNFWVGILFMLFGLFIISVGSFLYIGSELGAGPRDSLMIGLKKKMPAIPIGAIRGTVEGTVLLLGWLMGAKVGLGTVIAVFGISIILQFTFRLFQFDVKKLKAESISDTLSQFKQLAQKKQLSE